MKYHIYFTEQVTYRVEVEADKLLDVAIAWSQIYEEGDFHPIDDFHMVDERELDRITQEEGVAPSTAPENWPEITDKVEELVEARRRLDESRQARWAKTRAERARVAS